MAALVVLVVCALEWTHLEAFQRVEWMTFDWRVRLAHRYAPHTSNDATNLGVLEMSDNTIASVKSGEFGYDYGLYWPRQIYGRILEGLMSQGAKAVAFDVLFAETRTDQPGFLEPDGLLITSDDYFARQLKKAGNVVLAAEKTVLPDPFFRTNAWGIGNIYTRPDPDGVLRKDKAFVDYRDWHPIIKQIAAPFNLDTVKNKNRRWPCNVLPLERPD